MKWLFRILGGTTDKADGPMPEGSVPWLLGTFAYALLAHLSNLPWWLSLFTGGMLLWRWHIHRAGDALPPTWARVVLAVVLLSGLLADMQTIWGRDAGTALMVGLLSIKFMELRTARDYVLICFVCYFLVLGALLFSQTIFTCVYLLSVIVVITAALLRLQMSPKAGDGRSMVFSMAFRLLAQALPLAIILFLFFPRFQGQLGFQMNTGRKGLNDTLQAGTISSLVDDDEVAFRVQFPNGEDLSPRNQYWRALVLWNTDGAKWTMGERQEIPQPEPTPSATRIEQRFLLRPQPKAWLMALDHAVEVNPPAVWRKGGTIEVPFSERSGERKARSNYKYTVISEIGAKSQEMDDQIRKRALSRPAEVNPRVRALAAKWKEEGKTPQGILKVAAEFYKKGNFTYTTSPGQFGPDPVAEFLFKYRRGFCEHYVSATALLLRLADVPTRVIAGYYGGEENRFGGFHVVRQSNAHAWCEVWLEGEGWRRIDPVNWLAHAPLTEGIQALREAERPDMSFTMAGKRFEIYRGDWQPQWVRSGMKDVSERWDWLNQQWDEHVLGYDQFYQEQIFARTGLSWTGKAGLVAVMGTGLLTVLGLIYWWVGRRHHDIPEEVLLFKRFSRTLARAGVERHPWEGPLAFTARAGGIFSGQAAELREIGEMYARLRFGAGPAAKEEIAALRSRIQKLRLEEPVTRETA